MRLSPEATANLERAARDLGITPDELLERLASRVEVERAGRICLAGEDDE
jgi:hypothetical protein